MTRTLGKALDNVEKGRKKLAILQLRVFARVVKVFRGRKIDQADADAWIADAEAIIDMLRAQKKRPREPVDGTVSSMVDTP